MTASAFIKIDKAAFYTLLSTGPDGRFEFVRGRIMQQQPGGTLKHARIGTRFVTFLFSRLDGATWAVSGSDRAIDTGDTVRYPDAVVEKYGADGKSLSTTEPVLIVEVLSQDSAERDIVFKAQEYLSMATLEAYIVAGQDEPSCLIWTRDANGRFPAEPLTVTGTDKVLEIPALSLALPLAEIYRGIFAAPQTKD